MTTPRHDDVHALLGPAALGRLTDAEQQQLDEHLRGCASCREELAALTAVAQRLAALAPEEAVGMQLTSSPARTDAVMGVVARDRRRGQRLQALLATAASVSVLLAGLVTAAALGQPEAPAVPLEAVAVQADEGVQASADLVAHTWGLEIKLVATGLPAGRPYTVEVTTTAGQVADAGAFLGTGERTLTCNLNTSVLREAAASFRVLDASGDEVLTAQL